jgi:hypothetical protein
MHRIPTRFQDTGRLVLMQWDITHTPQHHPVSRFRTGFSTPRIAQVENAHVLDKQFYQNRQANLPPCAPASALKVQSK